MMKKRFIDASTILYAILEPTQDLPSNLARMKSNAKQILLRINKGERVLTSVVHLSEIANILEARCSFNEVSSFVTDLLMKESFEVCDVTKADYQGAAVLAKRYQVGINDSLAKLVMNREKIFEIYSFDKHFDNLNVSRITD